MIKLSKRLAALADFVTEGYVLADIGTDHGYIPIYLLENHKIPKAIAMDIGKGPLQRAKEHIASHGLGEYIETRLSDGADALQTGEADTLLIAGMGGGLTLHILTAGENVVKHAKELILQPQSEIEKVREYLYEQGYCIDQENMIYEEGKYYPMMHVSIGEKKILEESNRIFFKYGKLLLEQRHPVLKDYLFFMQNQYQKIQESLEKQTKTEAITDRLKQVKQELDDVNVALGYWR